MNTLATGPAHGGLNLPNLLTLSRVAAVPILAAALLVGGHAGYRIAFAIYCAASVTD